jgi:hypothetical protein
VESEPVQLAPGEVGWVFVELDAPLADTEAILRLTLTAPQGGRSLVIREMSLSDDKERP